MKTKFKVGDTVYCITQLHWFLQQWFVLAKTKIKKILIDNGKTRYGFTDTCGLDIYFKEKDCFLSQEEASIECKKRNIELKKEQEKFTERLKYLAALLHKKRDVVIELDITERENSSEIMEQLQCEEKTDSIEIRWKND